MQYFIDDKAADRVQVEMTRYLNQGQPVGISDVESELEICIGPFPIWLESFTVGPTGSK